MTASWIRIRPRGPGVRCAARAATLLRLAIPGAAAALALASAPRLAPAQVPTVQPDGSLAEPAAPPPAAAPAPAAAQGQPDAQGQPPAREGQPSGAARAGGGYYHTDEEYTGPSEPEPAEAAGPAGAPAVHVVRTGDTLWDLSWSYFNNPWQWPRLWSYNPEITNPHWIYPGDQVRLRPAGPPSPAARTARLTVTPASAHASAAPGADASFSLRQLAFVASEDLAPGMAISGSPEEKVMLATGDEVYLSCPEGRPPRVGTRYAVYLEKEPVRHPTTGAEVGAYVRVIGEVDVISAAAGKRARGVLVDVVDVIERGMKVGRVARQFHAVAATPVVADLEATIVAEVQSEELIGALQIVFLDRGADDRVRVGNILHVVRRGDGYQPVMGPPGGIGADDPSYPARSVGQIMVVETGRRSAVGVVLASDSELGVGDRVLMSRAQNRRRR